MMTQEKSTQTSCPISTMGKNYYRRKEYELDISFKKYKQVESISDEIEKQNIDVDISDFKDSSDFYLYLSKFDDQSSEEISVNGFVNIT